MATITKVEVKSCIVKGKRLVALDKKNKKWHYEADSETEADVLAEAVDKRGFVWTEYWRQA